MVGRSCSRCDGWRSLPPTLDFDRRLGARSKFDAAFVNGHLRWATGCTGKPTNLPILKGQDIHKSVENLYMLSHAVMDKRSDKFTAKSSLHRGKPATQIANRTTLIVGIERDDVPNFDLNERTERFAR